MQTSFDKKAGIALIIFTVLMIFTMILHPAGGSIEYLLEISTRIIVTHGIAIASLPFAFIGFWGLTRRIGADHFGSMLAFSFMVFALVAVMIAAAANGLVMPLFIQHYKDSTPETRDAVKRILRYSFAINSAFDYIYSVGFCVAMLLWSFAILTTKKLPAWTAWLGIILSIAGAVIFISGIAMSALNGFRLYVTSIVLWILVIGCILAREQKD